MTQQNFIDAYILLLSGAAKMKNATEMLWFRPHYPGGYYDTIEFVNSFFHTIVRNYYKDGVLRIKEEYKNGKRHGKSLTQSKTNVYIEKNYKDGELHGRYLIFNNNILSCEEIYKNGKLIRKLL